MCKVGDQKTILDVFVGQRGGLAQNSEEYLYFSGLLDLEDVSIFRYTVNLVVDHDRRTYIITVFGYDMTLFKFFDVNLTKHRYLIISYTSKVKKSSFFSMHGWRKHHVEPPSLK